MNIVTVIGDMLWGKSGPLAKPAPIKPITWEVRLKTGRKLRITANMPGTSSNQKYLIFRENVLGCGQPGDMPVIAMIQADEMVSMIRVDAKPVKTRVKVVKSKNQLENL